MNVRYETTLYEVKRNLRKGFCSLATAALLGSSIGPVTVSAAGPDDEELLFAVTGVIIELTDNDIELQAFVDGVEWTRVRLLDPAERTMFESKAKRRLKRQGGMSEMFWASEPTHYLEDEPEFDGPIGSFLALFPEGVYEFEGRTANGREIEGESTLTHVLPALPEILSPVSETDEVPVVDIDNLVIEWEPVTTRFFGDGPVQIVEYQVILDQVDPPREIPWIDGKTRRALINLPADVTALKVPPTFLLPNTSYEFEILAIEVSGNSTISAGEFDTGE